MARGTIQSEDLFRFQILQDARLSPNGRFAAYSVSSVDPDRDQECAAIRLIDLETGEDRRLTAGQALDTHPVWSPDGARLAFFSTRTGTRQLYSISIDGGEPDQLTELAQSLGRGPAWSPTAVHCLLGKAWRVAGFPEKPYRVTRHVYRLDGSGYLHAAAPDLWVVAAGGGELRNLTRRTRRTTVIAPAQSGLPIAGRSFSRRPAIPIPTAGSPRCGL